MAGTPQSPLVVVPDPGTQTGLVAELAAVVAVGFQTGIVAGILLVAAAGKAGNVAGSTQPSFDLAEQAAVQFEGFRSIVAAMEKHQTKEAVERSSEAPTEVGVGGEEEANSGPCFEAVAGVDAAAAEGQLAAGPIERRSQDWRRSAEVEEAILEKVAHPSAGPAQAVQRAAAGEPTMVGAGEAGAR